ncbi:hypothetical protein M413DRAFT_445314 [Hebeloma cylindrosporum]|uniref:Uncharacterized protein n=1 Tax=Hebeloma cylindrosporum TaxID=76867 RepID=A0A0C3CCE2_HEBCY|nr:hypothetical protein M413DRAFT_445314 [Hebeloma cylindrosporum h7]
MSDGGYLGIVVYITIVSWIMEDCPPVKGVRSTFGFYQLISIEPESSVNVLESSKGTVTYHNLGPYRQYVPQRLGRGRS